MGADPIGAFQSGQGNEPVNQSFVQMTKPWNRQHIYSAIARERSLSTVGVVIAPHGGVGKT
jgi:hypothetical protein